MSNLHLQKKICMLCVFGVGKTSLTERFVYNKFDESYLSTLGARVSQKRLSPVELADHSLVQVEMLIWDIEGFEPDSPLMHQYYRGAAGALLIGDLTRPDTLATLPKIATVFNGIAPGAPVVVVANKQDLAGKGARGFEVLRDVAREMDCPHQLASAKTGEGVQESFEALGRKLVGKR